MTCMCRYFKRNCVVKPKTAGEELLKRLIPPLVGIVLIALFVRLGFWQLDRAQQKIDMQRAFEKPARFALVSENLRPETFQAIEVRGRYLSDRQVVIENAILDGALGYYVITPLEYSSYEPLLLVNRGWIRKDGTRDGLPDIVPDDPAGSVRGKAGNLPRVGIRPGEAFADQSIWPRIGVWPTLDEVAAELGRDVLPYVLLLDPDQDDGYSRRWKPAQNGPSTHYGYAFQWFSMAIALLAIMAWNLRKRRRRDTR